MSYNTLDEDQKREFARILVARRKAYEAWTYRRQIDEQRDILLIADRPGPGAPKTDQYHHTPFYAKTYSGGWLNEQFVLAGLKEDRLLWENSADRHGTWRHPEILHVKPWKRVIALGNNAALWLTRNGVTDFVKVMHPQAHRRFFSKEEYPLIRYLLDNLKEG